MQNFNIPYNMYVMVATFSTFLKKRRIHTKAYIAKIIQFPFSWELILNYFTSLIYNLIYILMIFTNFKSNLEDLHFFRLRCETFCKINKYLNVKLIYCVFIQICWCGWWTQRKDNIHPMSFVYLSFRLYLLVLTSSKS